MEYTYDLQIVFDGTDDNWYVYKYKSPLDNIEDVKLDVLSQMVVHVYPAKES
jgi:hypothetical protein